MKIIVFYLPQFHTFPENDAWWGKGFTEWTNTKKAVPLFPGHYQPHIPLDNKYYDLVLDESTLKNQIKMAKEYGVDAFCYYHYWFANGKKLMEKPIERMLEDKKLDMPFCLCWANENWSRRWDGSEEAVLIHQDYDDESGWVNHFNYLCAFFKDRRYVKDKRGRPILLIYKPQLINGLMKHLDAWRNMAKQAGFPGLCLICQYPQYSTDVKNAFDYHLSFEPIATTASVQNNFLKAWRISPRQTIEVCISKLLHTARLRSYKKYNYANTVEASMKRPMRDKELLCAFPGWDNTARRKKNAIVYYNSTPGLFEKYVEAQLIKTKQNSQEEILFINAWNEWAEGAHLEPDEKFGMKYLEALKNAKQRTL